MCFSFIFTSPDTFASKTAAVGDKYADASIGNVTGSNAVNVFLGIGLAWSIAAIYHWDGEFLVERGALGFSVMLYSILAVIAIFVLMLRRKLVRVGGELGGPFIYQIITSIFFISLWLIYLILCSLVAYDIIPWENEESN